MIITLTGDNQYLIDAEINKLKNSLNETSDFSLVKINGPDASLGDIKMELASYSLFSDKRLVVVYQPSKIKGFDEYVKEASNDLPDETTLVIVEPSLDKRKAYYKFLQSGTDFRQFNKLSGTTLIKWVEEYTKNLSANISTDDSSYLIDRVGDDQLLLSQELVKLVLYSKDISKDSIDLLTEQSPSSTIFELLDAAFSLNTRKALTIYSEQRLQKVEPEQILAMISWQLNTLAIYMTSKDLPSSEVLSSSGLSPYTLSKAKNIASKLAFSDLKSLVYDLSSLDLRSKTSSFDIDEGLKNFIVGLNY